MQPILDRRLRVLHQSRSMRRNERLSKAQPSVTCGHNRMTPHFEATTFKLSAKIFQKNRIVKSTATEAHPIHPCPLTNDLRNTRKDFDQSHVKLLADNTAVVP